ncbi:hypothetical protein NL301_26905, partial [Klebsiella pneumoniae]|nr:hypothetical protein [Klebsiella pneumoniae]
MSLARNATASQSPTQTNGYERHQPDQTLLYQLVEQHYPAFKASLEAQGQHLPRYIQQEFNDLLQCGRLEGTVAKLAMRQPFVLFKGLTFQKLCLP